MKDRRNPVFLGADRDFPGIQMPLFLFLLWFFLDGAERCHSARSQDLKEVRSHGAVTLEYILDRTGFS